MSPELIVLDLDGTLIDSAPDLGHAVGEMSRRMGREVPSAEQVQGWIGNGVTLLIKRALTGEMNPAGEVPGYERAYALFSSIYEQNLCDRGRVYPGVREGLETLLEQGYTLACLTNKHSRFTPPLLERAGLAQYFEYVACGDTFEFRKPHPMPLQEIGRRFGVKAADSVMIGDSINDIQAAKAAGFVSVCVSYGYSGRYTPEELEADHTVDSLDQLPDLLVQTA